MGFERATSAQPALWVEEALRGGKFHRVSGTVPARFEAYVAVLYPAWRCVCVEEGANPEYHDEPGEPIRWADVAEAGLPVHYGIAPHSRFGKHWSNPTQYRRLDDGNWIVDELAGVQDLTPLLRVGDEWICGPRESLSRQLASILKELLGAATSTVDSCWYGIWDGYGWYSDEQRSGPAISTRFRRWLLYRAPLSELTTSTKSIAAPSQPTISYVAIRQDRKKAKKAGLIQRFKGDVAVIGSDVPDRPLPPAAERERELVYQCAELVWPDDRSWCLTPELDLPCVLIGGSRELVNSIMDNPGLETQELRPEDGFPRLGDVLKPVIEKPSELSLPPAFESRKPPKGKPAWGRGMNRADRKMMKNWLKKALRTGRSR